MSDLRVEDPVSLCEALDRVLHKGVVIQGEIVLSVADVDLVYLGLDVLLAGVDTAQRIGAYRTRTFLEDPCPS